MDWLKRYWWLVAILALMIALSLVLAIDRPEGKEPATVDWRQAVANMANFVTIAGLITIVIVVLQHVNQRLPEAVVHSAVEGLCDEQNAGKWGPAQATLVTQGRFAVGQLCVAAEVSKPVSDVHKRLVKTLGIILKQAKHAGGKSATLRAFEQFSANREFWTRRLQDAAEQGDAAAVGVAVLLGADLDARTSDGRTALHRASVMGHAEVVRLLIEAGADINAADDNGRTPLHRAVQQGHTEILRLLLELGLAAGADISAADNHGWTPLHMAAWAAHAEAVRLLLEAGADLNATENDGRTALHRAAEKGSAPVVDMLLGAGAEVNVRDNAGMTPLKLGSSQEVKQLLRQQRAEE